MATRQVLKEEFLTCIICHEVFRDPVTLHCGHTLCAQCVTEYTKTQKDALNQGCISCPHCRGLTKVPDSKKPVDKWTGQLKTGFFVQGLVEKFVLQRTDSAFACSLCKEDGEITPASVWCSDCGHALCSECQKVHGKLNKRHDVSLITEEYDRSALRKPRRTVCQKHPEFFIDLLCEDCDMAICQRCNTLKHRKCESVVMLDDALSRIDAVLEEQKKRVDKEVADGQSQVSALLSQVESLKSSTAKAETEIDSATEKLITKIREKQKQLKEELVQRKQETLQCMRADMKLPEMRLEESKQRQIFLQHAMESTDAHTHYEAYKLFSRSSVDTKNILTEPDNYEEYEFENNTDAFFNLLDQDNFGNVKEKKTVQRIDPKLVTKFDTSATDISGITVLYPQGKRTIVVAFTQSSCIKSYSVGDDMAIFQEDILQLEDQVYDITKIGDTKAVSCLYWKKQIMFVSVEPELALENKVETERNYFGITHLNSSTLGALSQNPGNVDIIDMSGTVLRTFGAETLSRYLYPGYISSVDDNQLLVSDRKKYQTVLFNHKGELQFTYDHRGASLAGVSGHMSFPDKNQLSVSDSNKYQTVLFSQTGHVQFGHGNHGETPAGVCQGRTGELFVVNSNKVFEISESGEFVNDVIASIDGLNSGSTLFVDGKFMYLSAENSHISIYQYLS